MATFAMAPVRMADSIIQYTAGMSYIYVEIVRRRAQAIRMIATNTVRAAPAAVAVSVSLDGVGSGFALASPMGAGFGAFVSVHASLLGQSNYTATKDKASSGIFQYVGKQFSP
jgi:hypothetical protein